MKLETSAPRAIIEKKATWTFWPTQYFHVCPPRPKPHFASIHRNDNGFCCSTIVWEVPDASHSSTHYLAITAILSDRDCRCPWFTDEDFKDQRHRTVCIISRIQGLENRYLNSTAPENSQPLCQSCWASACLSPHRRLAPSF